MDGENQLFCQKCDKKHDGLLWRSLELTPLVLCVVVNRFKWDATLGQRVKLKEQVEIELHLDLAKHRLSIDQYMLFGIVCHSGSAQSGHYISFCRDANDAKKAYEMNQHEYGSWRKCNDENSMVVPFRTVQIEANGKGDPTPYFAFYTKVYEKDSVSVAAPIIATPSCVQSNTNGIYLSLPPIDPITP